MRIEDMSCRNCIHLKKLIMWEYDKEHDTDLPNISNPKECCVALIGANRVYGFKAGTVDMCELWEGTDDQTT